MKVSEYITHLISSECGKLAVSNVGDMSINPAEAVTAVQLANQGKFLSYINLANLAVHKKFQLVQKSIELDQPSDGEEYALPTDFLVPIQAYYTSDQEEVTIKDSHIKLVAGVDTAVSILIPEPFKAVIKGTDADARTQIIMNYAAAPKAATRVSTNLGISEVYTDALLNYAAYKAHTAISGAIKDENNTYYLRFDSSCKELVKSGMWNNQIKTNTKLVDNGFV